MSIEPTPSSLPSLTDLFKKKFATFNDKVFEFFSKTFGPAVAKTDAATAALFPDTDRLITERRYRCATKRPRRAGVTLTVENGAILITPPP